MQLASLDLQLDLGLTASMPGQSDAAVCKQATAAHTAVLCRNTF